VSEIKTSSVDLDALASLAKRRGFIFQSSEIYGGMASTWDYGPLGVELKRNIKDVWWRKFVWERDDMVGLDSSILMNPEVWRASGHLDNFTDPLVDCRECRQRWREDQLEEQKCPACGGELTEARNFNLMFKTFVGPVEDDASVAFLRPETAQGIFVNFENVLNSSRKRLPFGIAQIGKAFRNEITTGGFIFRTREFEMMEIEYFVEPGTDEQVHEQWIEDCLAWYTDLGVSKDRLRVRPHDADELSHYSKATYDIEYLFPWGWGEIQGIANRTDFDLKAHSERSGHSLTYFDQAENKRFTPYVVEPAAGVDRAVMTFMVDAYTEEEAPTASGGTQKRVLLKLHPTIAPVKVSVLPLSRNDRLVPLAREVYDMVRRSGAVDGFVQYDDAQSIGRRYRRQDEIGTPLCITVDFDSLDDHAVTIRDRDTMEQARIPIASLEAELGARLQA
jgi:glycyl-tRNA synthetase